MSELYSVRIPVHGFVDFNEWERDIINHHVFQRLRRIRQLALSEHVYPGSTHSRFEHSLGVMHVATRLFDVLVTKHRNVLVTRLKYSESGLERARALVRLSALLHDVGHGPFSHTAEELMPKREDGRSYDHEAYSSELIREEMKDVIDDHSFNLRNLCIRASEVADFYSGAASKQVAPHQLWRDLVHGTIDADRMDYLLRDSYHCGVDYGKFDLDRIVNCFTLISDPEDDGNLRIGIKANGRHAAEGLLLARYFMFIQVYFHKTRRAYDYHAAEIVRLLLLSRDGLAGRLPDPATPEGRTQFLELDDWVAFDFLKHGECGRHKGALLNRSHDRMVDETTETAGLEEIQRHEGILRELQAKGIDAWSDDESRSWYKVDRTEVMIGEKPDSDGVSNGRRLSDLSAVVNKIVPSSQRRIYVPSLQVQEATLVIESVKTEAGGS